MGLRIWIQKALLVLYIRSLDEDTLAGRIYKEQNAKNWPGLVQETKYICRELEIEDHTTVLNKTDSLVQSLACPEV